LRNMDLSILVWTSPTGYKCSLGRVRLDPDVVV
jgi:hypothetical protein